MDVYKYLLLTKFEDSNSFLTWIYGPSARHAGHKFKWEKKEGSVTHSMDQGKQG